VLHSTSTKKRKNLVVVESTVKAETLKSVLSTDSKIDWRFYVFEDELTIGKKLVEGSYVVTSTMDDTSYNFKIEISGVENIWIATNPDAEGEAIASIINKKALRYSEARVRRVQLKELTEEHIRLAFTTAELVDANLADSWWTRNHIYQWQATKLAMGIGNILACSKVQRDHLYTNPVGLLLLSLIEKKEKEIQNFTVNTTYKVVLPICKNTALACSLGFTLQEDAQKHLEKLRDAIDEKKIEANYSEEKYPFKIPAPYTTHTALNNLCKEYKLTPNKILKYMKDLYELGYITFYKTNRKSLNRKFAEYLWKNARAQGLLVLDKPKNYSEYNKNGEFIRPTSYSEDLPITLKTQAIYSNIFSRVKNTQLKPASLIKQKVVYTLDNGQEILAEAFGIALEKAGVHDLAETQQQINEGFIKRFGEPYITNENTIPPQRWNKATLYSWMTTYNITHINLYENILNNIIDNNYVSLDEDSNFHLTEKGDIIITTLRDLGTEVEDYLFFSQLEEDLQDLAEGNKTVIDIENDYGETGYEVLRNIGSEASNLRFIPKTCLKCKKVKCTTQVLTQSIGKYCMKCHTHYKLVMDPTGEIILVEMSLDPKDLENLNQEDEDEP
jgi:DNA topoisomerase-1